MDKDQAWQVIHRERAALAEMLEVLTPQEWEQPSLCDGWSVRDVAAHVIGGAEATIPQMALAAIHARGNLNRAIHEETKRVSSRPTAEILADYRRLATSRRPAPATSHREALLDVLVHTQDIAIPLGRHHDMPVEAARDSAEHALRFRFLWHARKRLAGYRLEATDIDWSEGEGPSVRGPMWALLLLVTGRPVALSHLGGEGIPRLRAQMQLEGMS